MIPLHDDLPAFSVYVRGAPAPPDLPDGVEADVMTRRKAPPLPPRDLLVWTGLGEDEAARLDGATHVLLVLATEAPVREAHLAARRLARERGGVVYDLACRRVERLDLLEEDPGEGVVGHIQVMSSQDEDGTLLTTVGMRKFGLPDLELSMVPIGAARAAVRLLNGVAQALLESIGPKGASATVRVDRGTLARAYGRAPDAGDGAVDIELTEPPDPARPLWLVGPVQGHADGSVQPHGVRARARRRRASLGRW